MTKSQRKSSIVFIFTRLNNSVLLLNFSAPQCYQPALTWIQCLNFFWQTHDLKCKFLASYFLLINHTRWFYLSNNLPATKDVDIEFICFSANFILVTLIRQSPGKPPPGRLSIYHCHMRCWIGNIIFTLTVPSCW